MIGRVLTTIEKQKPKHEILMERKTLELQSLSAIQSCNTQLDLIFNPGNSTTKLGKIVFVRRRKLIMDFVCQLIDWFLSENLLQFQRTKIERKLQFCCCTYHFCVDLLAFGLSSEPQQDIHHLVLQLACQISKTQVQH